MVNKIEIVKFRNGKFGVRMESGIFWKEYCFLDMHTFDTWHSLGRNTTRYQTDDVNIAAEGYDRFMDEGIPV
jgi:hypothetical protein